MTLFSPRRWFLQVGLALVALSAGGAMADQILSLSSDSLTTYKPSSATAIQGVRPQAWQRVAYPDGSVRAGTAQGVSIYGSPGNDVGWNGRGRSGSLMLNDGSAMIDDVDLALPARGMSGVVIGRSYNARQESGGSAYDSAGYQGNNWFQSAQPEIVLYDDADNTKDMVYVVFGADRYAEYKRTGSSSDVYRGVNGTAGVVYFQAGATSEPDTYTLYDLNGTRLVFFGFDADAGAAAGQFWKKIDPAGNTAYVGNSSTGSTAISSGFSSGKITKLYDGEGRLYEFTYDGSNLLTRVEVKVGGSATGYKVEYGYMGGSGTYGSSGDLMTVTITTPMTDSGVNDVRTKYYRYWKGTYNSSTNPGHVHDIQYIVDFEGYRAADWADSTFDDTPQTMSESSLKPYASAFFKYDASHRVSEAWYSGQCGCGGGAGNGTYTFEYEASGYTTSAGYDTAWASRTTIDRPDSAFEVQYFDETGMPLHHVLADGDPDISSGRNYWVDAVTRNSDAQITKIRTPADIALYKHTPGVGEYLKDMGPTSTSNSKLVRVFDRWTSGDGDFGGFVKAAQHSLGTGTAQYDSRTAYTTQTMTVGSYTFTRALPSGSRAYHTEGSTEGSNYDETTYSYTFWTGDAVLMPKVITTTNPIVTTGNNGSNAATVTKRYARKDGTTAFTESATNRFSYTKYSGGQAIMSIQDVKTNDTGDIDTTNDDPNTIFGVTESGDGVHRKTEYAYDGQGRPTTVTRSSEPVTLSYYSVLADRRLVTVSFPKYVAGTPEYWGPASYRVSNQAGGAEFTGTIAYSGGKTTSAITSLIDETDSDPILAVNVGSLSGVSTTLYNETGTRPTETRSYFLIPGSGAGSKGTNYDRSKFGYDDMGRRIWTADATDTITRTVYDTIGRFSSSKSGTNDYGEAGGSFSGSVTNNMTKTSEVVYDAGSVGNGYITKRTAFLDAAGSPAKRETTITYDERGRALLTQPPTAPYTFSKYDNRGRVVAVGLYSSPSGLPSGKDPTSEATNRWALSETAYDQLGRSFKTTRHKIDASDGSDDDTLVSENWYNADGLLIKSIGEQFMKYEYDRLNRRVVAATIAKSDDSTYAHASDCGGDVVALEQWTIYESSDCDRVVMTGSIERLHTDLTNGTTTHLNTETDLTSDTFTYNKINGRLQIQCTWYDSLDRPKTSASYGTAGIDGVGGGSSFDRSGQSEPSASSSTVLVAKTSYNDNGTVLDRTGVDGAVTRTLYDDARRAIATIANYTGASTPIGTANRANDIYTRYTYVNGLRTEMWSDLDGDNTKDTDDPVTTWAYGITRGTAGADNDSWIASNRLLDTVTYPDGNGSELVEYKYNAQNEVHRIKDQASTIHLFSFDGSGRRTSDVVDGVGTDIDGAVRRVEWVYDNLGRVSTVVQYDATSSGTALDGEKYTYDGWSNLTTFEQDHDSAVGTGSAYSVSYSYAKATSARRTLRRSGMTMPDGSSLTYEYVSTGYSLDDGLSRVSDVMNGALELAAYSYNGVATLVDMELSEPGADWTVYGGSPGSYTGWDRFNRPVNHVWTKAGTTARLYELSITYGTSSTDAKLVKRYEDEVLPGMDEAFSFDALDRLTQVQEGTWNGSSITSKTRQEDWTLDQFRNWITYKRDANADNAFNAAVTGDIYYDGTFDKANKYTKRTDKRDSGSSDKTMAYTKPGALADDGVDYKMVYDAWGRLVKVKNQAGTLVSECRYSGTGARITWHDDADASGLPPDGSDPVYHLVVDEGARMLTVYRGSDNYAKEQSYLHVFGLNGYSSAKCDGTEIVIVTTSDKTNAWSAVADNTMETKNYLIANHRGDVSAVISDTGRIRERVKYSAYGVPYLVMRTDWDADGKVDTGTGVSTDYDKFYNDYFAGSPPARADYNLDGSIDPDDLGDFISEKGADQGGAYGYGRLSAPSVGNGRAFHGWSRMGSVNTQWYVSGNRVMIAPLGRAAGTFGYTAFELQPGSSPDGPCDPGIVIPRHAPQSIPIDQRPIPDYAIFEDQLKGLCSGIYEDLTPAQRDEIKTNWNSLCPQVKRRLSISCRDCTTDEGSKQSNECGNFYARGHEIVICTKRSNEGPTLEGRAEPVCKDTARTILHELRHAQQACEYGIKWDLDGRLDPSFDSKWSDTDARVCQEYDAYNRTGECDLNKAGGIDACCQHACGSLKKAFPNIVDCVSRCRDLTWPNGIYPSKCQDGGVVPRVP